MDMQINEFIRQLSSKAPVPGGGGASALIGAIGAALCSMVANLTSGKKKYVEYQKEMELIIAQTQESIGKLLNLIQKDADVFEPLSKAYGISKNDPNRDAVMENALAAASSVPLEIMREISNMISVLEQLSEKGSKLAVSDVAVAASACKSALEGAVITVYINTKLMKNRAYAEMADKEAGQLLQNGARRCETVYQKVLAELR